MERKSFIREVVAVVLCVTGGCMVEELPYCGNGILEQGEECDDGNIKDGDGCSAVCVIETAIADGDGVLPDKSSDAEGVAMPDGDEEESPEPVLDKDVPDTPYDQDAATDSAPDPDTVSDHDAFCGNAVVEAGEVCDGNTASCRDLTDGEKVGTTYCNTTCSGWDLTTCTQGPHLALMEPVVYSTTYIYPDIASVESNPTPAFYGTAAFRAQVPAGSSGTYSIPHPQSDNHLIPTIVTQGTVIVMQDSYAGTTFTLPYTLLAMTQSTVVNGATLKVGIASNYEANFLVMDNTVDPNDPNYDCVILVGFGTLHITQANIVIGASGRLSFTSDNLRLYLPSNTPDGDMQSEITAAGFLICQ